MLPPVSAAVVSDETRPRGAPAPAAARASAGVSAGCEMSASPS